MVPQTNLPLERPAPPPGTQSPAIQKVLQAVRDTVNNITPAQLSTVYKWADGVSTPTPPGHWDYIVVPYIQAAKTSEVRTARTFALLNMALHHASVACWETKYFYFNPRPTQVIIPRQSRGLYGCWPLKGA